MTVTTCSCNCDNFTFTFPRNCFHMRPFWIPFPFCPYLPPVHSPLEIYNAGCSSMCWKCHIFLLCQQPWELDLSRPSYWLSWDSLFLLRLKFNCRKVTDCPYEFDCQKGHDWFYVWFFGFFPLLHGCIWLPMPILTLPPRFSLFTSHTVSPLPLSSLLNLGLFWLFLLSFWSLLKARISIMFPPVSSSVHSKYLLKEYSSSKHFLLRKVDTKTADGPGRAFILNKSWKSAWYLYRYSSCASPAGRLNNDSVCVAVFLFQICIQEARRVKNSIWGKCDPSLLCSPETYKDNLCNKFYNSSFTGLTTCILNTDYWISSLHFF